MERLMKELMLEKQKLEQLKADVNNMEYDALQRRFRRVNSTSLIPRPEEMTRLRSLNRQLQIDIDCTLKETDLLQSREPSPEADRVGSKVMDGAPSHCIQMQHSNMTGWSVTGHRLIHG
ncbi:TGF-beta-activated kinase 1 and MAP3K7-binding protein 3-like isoform X2 [Seriola lalandi dorsalis]|nr:TGF-beta-activated kinase 1 and MAP3K7-binding protein 3-like isoform X2 [Seriola lalandi dorsalis]XP_023261318.1 TGF-beta-activated kinase 1 and MAP3K7-binding protein 3-like isoform X2 [Seriola lalandi dorsalis]